jgi:hypothetical protein
MTIRIFPASPSIRGDAQHYQEAGVSVLDI